MTTKYPLTLDPTQADDPSTAPEDKDVFIGHIPGVGDAWYRASGDGHCVRVVMKGEVPRVQLPDSSSSLQQEEVILNGAVRQVAIQRVLAEPKLLRVALSGQGGRRTANMARAALERAESLLRGWHDLPGAWNKHALLAIGETVDILVCATPTVRPPRSTRTDLACLILDILGYPHNDTGYHLCFERHPRLAIHLYGALRPDRLDLRIDELRVWVSTALTLLDDSASCPGFHHDRSTLGEPDLDPPPRPAPAGVQATAVDDMPPTRWVPIIGALAVVVTGAGTLYWLLIGA